ncbi:DUF742 domain-containing protein (plasmid) [Streptomyces sp. QH1-20]|uniref:DUF742 domain-containing protein n=1 Tax=Streptomyces sp. QH1-20 TaxID=3240934 RepID=UPI00351448AA
MPQQPTEPPSPGPPPLAPRPYTITAGRTVTGLELPLEALVVTERRGPVGAQPEHELILSLCTEAASIAEVSAHLRVPVGVARILVADLSAVGFVSVMEPVGDQPTTALLERVLSGLHSL